MIQSSRQRIQNKKQLRRGAATVLMASLFCFATTPSHASNDNIFSLDNAISFLGQFFGDIQDTIELAVNINGLKMDHFWHNGVYRKYVYYVPPTAKPNAPLMLQFPGALMSAHTFRIFFDIRDVADREGFVVMWATGAIELSGGLGIPNFMNGGVCCAPATTLNIDDNGYVRKAISRIQQRASIDTTRIYASGLSNGGIMSHRLGLESADKIAAIASISYPLSDNDSWSIPDSWKSNTKTAALSIHSKDDGLIDYYGSMTLGNTHWPIWENLIWEVDSAEKGRENWARLNGCNDQVQAPFFADQPQGPYTQIHNDCQQGVSVGLLTLLKGNHGPLLPSINGGVNLKNVIWDFVKDYSKPGHKSDRMWEKQELYRGQYLQSPDKVMRLTFQSDSNLVLKNTISGATEWRSNTSGKNADKLVMQDDGNLVMYTKAGWGWQDVWITVPDPKWYCLWCTKRVAIPVWQYIPSKAVWATGTNGIKRGEDRLELSNNGELAIRVDGHKIWSVD